MLWYLHTASRFICNGGGAWPFSHLALLGSTVLTVIVTGILILWAWKSLSDDLSTVDDVSYKPFFWALLGATGLSHALERAAGQCIVDYWHLSFFGNPLYFNLGDLSLTIGTIFLIGSWLGEHKIH